MPVFPFPEISSSPERASGWTVRHGTGSTALLSACEGRVMNVPLGRRAHARAVRLHEMLHKELSPYSDGQEIASTKADPGIVQAVEDLRLHYKAIHQFGMREEISHLAELHDLPLLIRTSPENSAFLGVLSVAPIDGVIPAADHLYGLRAEALADEGNDSGAARFEFFRRLMPPCLKFAADFYEETKESDDPMPFEFTRMLSEVLEKLLNTPSTNSDDKPDTDLPKQFRWAPMKIVTPLLTTMRNIPVLRRRRHTARDVGVIMRNPGRYALDRAVFSRSKPIREAGGTILVDISASMEFKPADVDKIIAMTPAAVVATYCADLGGEKNPQSAENPWGELSIVAHNKRRVGTLTRMGTHNLIDGPALEWLSKQEGPLYWVSDGIVTCLDQNGCRAKPSIAVVRCMEMCRKHNIKWITDVDTLISTLRKGVKK